MRRVIHRCPDLGFESNFCLKNNENRKRYDNIFYLNLNLTKVFLVAGTVALLMLTNLYVKFLKCFEHRFPEEVFKHTTQRKLVYRNISH